MTALSRYILDSGLLRRPESTGACSDKKQVQELYDGPAGAALLAGSILSLHEPLVGRLLERREFDVSHCRRILDVGSGAGQILKHLKNYATPGSHLIAFDLSHGMLRRARARIGQARISYITGDLTRLPFPDQSFDCITCGWVLEHLPDPGPGLQEFYRVLRSGGRLLLLATENTWRGELVARTWKCRTYSRAELKTKCERAGLRWRREMWFTPMHRRLKLGGILVEVTRQGEGSGTLTQVTA